MTVHGNLIDETGNRYGRLVVLEEAGRARRNVRWRCLCDCGGETVVRGSTLRRGEASSCGCLRREVTARRHTTHGQTAGGSWSPTYQSWKAMKDRCLNPNKRRYKDYGGRGITVHPEWVESFEAFLRDVGERPSPDLSLDRIDNDGNYEPGNVRWATRFEQANNRG